MTWQDISTMKAEFAAALPEILEGRDPIDIVRCNHCAMTFKIMKPADGRAEVARCSEPGCGRRFWHVGMLAHGKPSAKVGVFPADAKRIEP